MSRCMGGVLSLENCMMDDALKACLDLDCVIKCARGVMFWQAWICSYFNATHPPPGLSGLCPTEQMPVANSSSAPVAMCRAVLRLLACRTTLRFGLCSMHACVCVCVQSISKRHLHFSITPPTFSNPSPSFLHHDSPSNFSPNNLPRLTLYPCAMAAALLLC